MAIRRFSWLGIRISTIGSRRERISLASLVSLQSAAVESSHDRWIFRRKPMFLSTTFPCHYNKWHSYLFNRHAAVADDKLAGWGEGSSALRHKHLGLDW